MAYTDVDFHVFTEGARLLASGRSPFKRPTYRYSPALAALLLPSALHPVLGKVVFCICDAGAALLVYTASRGPESIACGGPLSHRDSLIAAASWALHPILCQVSSIDPCVDRRVRRLGMALCNTDRVRGVFCLEWRERESVCVSRSLPEEIARAFWRSESTA